MTLQRYSIVGGLYINISIENYLRAIEGVHEKDTT